MSDCDVKSLCQIQSQLLLLPFFHMSFILGRKTRHKVAVVDARIIEVMMMNASVTCSESKFARTTTLTLVITAPYTENPIY
ncbi:CLUMA_CG007570, isoform A [Clunio marinus]|uniref:CLUMA_CG007570, isoform A n=1 Tax=Clunio marinus TaxID=568069 RepID=A0A1J1I556_9DIPT|nr:CLUMA_CG007570, isoform A [Clunio marinus]